MNTIELNKVYNEDCRNTMENRIPENYVDLIVTSPPYDNLRDYSGTGWGFEMFKGVAHGIAKVLKPGGVCVWVVNDATIDGSETGTSFRQALYFKDECGLNIHDTMIYSKPASAYPSNSNSKRYSQAFEYMFVFSKGVPKTVNLLMDKPNKYAGTYNRGVHTERQQNGELIVGNRILVKDFGARLNVWTYATGYGNTTFDDVAYEHPAIFPEKLAQDHILSWSDEGDIVYDPFMGSGTTAKMCLLNNRKFIGSEISEEYISIIDKRIKELNDNKQVFESFFE